MSRRSRRRQKQAFWGSMTAPGSKAYKSVEYSNQYAGFYAYHMERVITLAISRFKYTGEDAKLLNLPYFERIMFGLGYGAFAVYMGVPLAGKCVKIGHDIYGEPNAVEYLGENGLRFEIVNNTDLNILSDFTNYNGTLPIDIINNGVFLYDNNNRLCLNARVIPMVSRLAMLDMAYAANMQQLQLPYIISGREEQITDLDNMMRDIGMQRPFTVGIKGFHDGIELSALTTNVNNLLESYSKEKLTVYNEIKSILGLTYIEDVYKNTTRIMTYNEMATNADEITLTRLGYLEPRRKALERYNEILKEHGFAGDIEIVWNIDEVSDDYRVNNSIAEQSRLGLIGQGVTTTALDTDTVEKEGNNENE